MSSDFKVIERNADRLQGRTLVVGPLTEPQAWVLADLVGQDALTFLLDDVGTHARLLEAGFAAEHAPWPSQSAAWDTVLVLIPVGRERLVYALAAAAFALVPGGRVLIAGPNDLGARSAASRIEPLFAHVEKVDFAQRWSLFEAREPVRPLQERASFRGTWSLPVPGGEPMTIVDYPGMFSRGALDDATAMLLGTLPDRVPGRVLDVGAGAGVIGAFARRRGAREVVLAETSAVSLEGARETLAANGLDNVSAVASDVYSGVEGAFDRILSNPPFHRQKETDLSVTRRILAEAANHLAPGGELRIVANRFLPYAEMIREVWGSLDVLADDGRFRVLAVTPTPQQLRKAREALNPAAARSPSRGRAAGSNPSRGGRPGVAGRRR